MGRTRRRSPSPPVLYGTASLKTVAGWLDRGSPALAKSDSQSAVDRTHAVGREMATRLREIAGKDQRQRDANLIASTVTGVGSDVPADPAGRIAAVNALSGQLWYAATSVFTNDEQASDLAFALSVCVRMEAVRMVWEHAQARLEAPDFLETYRGMVMDSIALVETGHGRGSAFCIGSPPDEYSVWLTAEHVVRERGEAWLHTAGGSRWPVEMIETRSGEHDVAILKTALDAPPLRLGAEPFPGTDVYALGYGGYRWGPPTIIRGRVNETYDRAGLRYVRSDAAVYPGNSGGPLLDIEGSVVGMIQQSDRRFVVALSVDSIPVEARRAQPQR